MTTVSRHLQGALTAALASFGLAQAAAAQDCTPQHQITTVKPGVLTVAAPTFPPFSIPNADGTLTGVDGEIVNEIARRECLKVEVAPVEYATAVPYVSSGRADVAIGDFYRTADRAKVVNISAPLYLDEMGLYSKDGVSSLDALAGRKVGTVQGYLWVDEMKKLLGNDLRLYNNYVALYQDLDAGRIDVGADGLAVGTAAQKGGALKGIQIKVAEPDERVATTIKPAQAGLPLSKDNPDLLTAVDEILADMHASGKIVEILGQFDLPASAADVGEARLVGG